MLSRGGETQDEFEARFWSRVQIPNDVCGGCWVWTGGRSKAGYGTFSRHNKTISAHRTALELTGRAMGDSNAVVDHLCHRRECVNPMHLRLCSQRSNMHNMKRKCAGEFSSRFPCVSWYKKTGRWAARFETGSGGVRKTHWVGEFDSEFEAYRAVHQRLHSLGLSCSDVINKGDGL